VHAHGAGIVVRLAGHVLGHHGTHPVDQALGGILALDAADRHVGSGGGGGSGGHGSGRWIRAGVLGRIGVGVGVGGGVLAGAVLLTFARGYGDRVRF